jgi:hypothetical protein
MGNSGTVRVFESVVEPLNVVGVSYGERRRYRVKRDQPAECAGITTEHIHV